jgi:RND family efflux transporter MFP subunit
MAVSRSLSSFRLAGLALTAALVISACSAPSTPSPATQRQAPTIPVSAAPVERGDIQQSLAYSGDIRASGQITVFAKGSGRVERMLVDVGSRVSAGDRLAELDADNASFQMLQARAALTAAEAKLAQVRSGGKVEDVAAAQAALRQQEARLASMRSGGRANDVGLAETALEAQQAKLDLMEQGGRAEAVAQAQAALAAARARLSSVQRGATDDLRQAAQSAVDSDRAAVAAAEAALAHLANSSAADVQAAQGAYETAQAHAAAARAALAQADKPLDAQVAAAQANVASAEANLRSARDARNTALAAPAAPAAAGAPGQPALGTNEAVVAAQRAVTAARAQLDLVRSGGGPANKAQLDAAVEEADAGVATAKARLDALSMSGVEAQRSLAESQLIAAREKLRSDEARLNEVLRGPHQDDITQAAAAVEQAEQQLALAESPATEQEIRAQRALVEQARLQVEKARAPYTSYDIEEQTQAVAQARAMLQGRRNPFTPEEAVAAQASVDEAQARLALAELGVRESVVYAPVDGIIADRQVAQGALVSPNTPIVTLVPPSLELLVNVEETQLGQVQEGQPVNLQVAAFPGKTFTGSVAAISPTVDAKTRTASVRVVPHDGDQQLRAGMLARLSITTAFKPGALIVPRESLLPGFAGGASSVMVVDEGNRARRVPVGVGLTGDRTIEILSGLREGQLVVTSGVTELTDGDQLAPQVQLAQR